MPAKNFIAISSQRCQNSLWRSCDLVTALVAHATQKVSSFPGKLIPLCYTDSLLACDHLSVLCRRRSQFYLLFSRSSVVSLLSDRPAPYGPQLRIASFCPLTTYWVDVFDRLDDKCWPHMTCPLNFFQ